MKKNVKVIVKIDSMILDRFVRKGCEEEFKKYMYDLFGDSCTVVFEGEDNEK